LSCNCLRVRGCCITKGLGSYYPRGSGCLTRPPHANCRLPGPAQSPLRWHSLCSPLRSKCLSKLLPPVQRCCAACRVQVSSGAAAAHRVVRKCTYAASFIIPCEHLQLVITSRYCHCFPIGINVHQLFSRSRRKPVAHFGVNLNVPMRQPVPFTGRGKNNL
jgi:hypothetical protein